MKKLILVLTLLVSNLSFASTDDIDLSGPNCGHVTNISSSRVSTDHIKIDTGIYLGTDSRGNSIRKSFDVTDGPIKNMLLIAYVTKVLVCKSDDDSLIEREQYYLQDLRG